MERERQEPERTPGGRYVAAIGIGIASVFLVIVIGGYFLGWRWTGLAERTFWDWLELLVVPAVLALGGYLFTRSENRRALDVANQQRALDREIADERRQDDMLQAYLDGMSQLLTDKDRPLHRAQPGDSLSTVARARTLTVLTRLDSQRKRSTLEFLYESGLIRKDSLVLDLSGADLSWANLSWANLSWAGLSWVNLRGADLRGADLRGAGLGDAIVFQVQLEQAASLEGATMPDGQKYEDWLKSKGGREE